MAMEPSRRRSISPETRALRLARQRHRLTNPIVVSRAEDVLRTTSEPIYRFRIASLSDANHTQHDFVLDRTGAELNLAEIRQRDGVEYFRETVGAAPIPGP